VDKEEGDTTKESQRKQTHERKHTNTQAINCEEANLDGCPRCICPRSSVFHVHLHRLLLDQFLGRCQAVDLLLMVEDLAPSPSQNAAAATASTAAATYIFGVIQHSHLAVVATRWRLATTTTSSSSSSSFTRQFKSNGVVAASSTATFATVIVAATTPTSPTFDPIIVVNDLDVARGPDLVGAVLQ
jgi:hypothetical protein